MLRTSIVHRRHAHALRPFVGSRLRRHVQAKGTDKGRRVPPVCWCWSGNGLAAGCGEKLDQGRCGGDGDGGARRRRHIRATRAPTTAASRRRRRTRATPRRCADRDAIHGVLAGRNAQELCSDGRAGTEQKAIAARAQTPAHSERLGFFLAEGRILPSPEDYATPADDDCSGAPDDTCAVHPWVRHARLLNGPWPGTTGKEGLLQGGPDLRHRRRPAAPGSTGLRRAGAPSKSAATAGQRRLRRDPGTAADVCPAGCGTELLRPGPAANFGKGHLQGRASLPVPQTGLGAMSHHSWQVASKPEARHDRGRGTVRGSAERRLRVIERDAELLQRRARRGRSAWSVCGNGTQTTAEPGTGLPRRRRHRRT